jgi:predicted nucleic acid-binding protein
LALAEVVLLDEQRAVEFARTQGLTVFRSGTIFLAAKRAGFIPAVRPSLEALPEAGFWIKASDYQAVLRMCGEAQ